MFGKDIDSIDVEILERPKTLLGQKICQWLEFKTARVGETGRCIERGFYLLPKANEEKFMMYKTWWYENPLAYCVYCDGSSQFSIVYGCTEEELFYHVFLTIASSLCFQIDPRSPKYSRNPLFGMTAEEAMVWLDLNLIDAWHDRQSMATMRS